MDDKNKFSGRLCYVCQKSLHKHDPRARETLAAFAASLVFAVAALPALAQQQGQAAPNAPAAPYDYGYQATRCGAGRDGAGIPSW